MPARPARKSPSRHRSGPSRPARKPARRAGGKVVPIRDPFSEKALTETFVELYRRAATNMPPDVLEAVERAIPREDPGSVAQRTLQQLLENSKLASASSRPICQDTGMPLFEVAIPRGVSIGAVERAAAAATKKATAAGFLRPNSVDTPTGRNPGHGAGKGMPIVHVHEHAKRSLAAAVMLKGGGCENVGAQYSLPDAAIGADRDLSGVKKCVYDAIHKAQGKGCAPGVLGVCFGGDRTSSMGEAKAQLFRKITDVNPDPALRAMEDELFENGNRLGIGPMGFGGRTTILGVKVSWLSRLPASYFVSVSYMCWATRRAWVDVAPSGKAVYSQ